MQCHQLEASVSSRDDAIIARAGPTSKGGYRDETGSIPCFSITGLAVAPVKNVISCLAPSAAFDVALTAPVNVTYDCTSDGNGPTSSTPVVVKIG
jgi:hypothetical protein